AAEENTPTGDNAPIILFAVVLLALGIVLVRKVAFIYECKKRRNNMAKHFFPIYEIMMLLISLVASCIQPVIDEEKEDKVYKDGEYDITAKALHADKDEASGAASFIDESAIILIDNGQIKLAISIPKNEMAEIKGLQIEGINPVKEETDDSVIYTYALNELKEILNAQVQYEVESMGMEHDVPLR